MYGFNLNRGTHGPSTKLPYSLGKLLRIPPHITLSFHLNKILSQVSSNTLSHTMPTTLTRAEKSCICALSALFLDKNLADGEFDDIARALARLPLELAEINMMFWDDLFPTLIWNLLKIHGQQHAFDEEAVCGKIEVIRAGSTRSPHSTFAKKLLFGWMVWHDWMRVKRRLVDTRKLS